MTRIADLAGVELEWIQPGALKMNYELRRGDETVGSLRFRSSWGTCAAAESPDGCWTFKRAGFWQTRVTIRLCESDHDLAVFKPNTWSGGGSLEFPNGRRIRATTNFWQTRLEWCPESENGEPLVCFHTHGLVHLVARVEILPAAARHPDLALMVHLGWYLIVMMYMDSAAMSGAVAAAA
jgi:hypothetical protein